MILRPDIFLPSDRIVAGFSTRQGGASKSPYDSLNLGLSTNDQREHVLENRRRLFESVGFSLDRLAIAGQVHGVECEVVAKPGLYEETDALVSRVPGILLCLSAADCAAVLLADEKNGVVGACHAGWRGAAGGIVKITIDAMCRLGAQVSSISAYVSPCISKESFEVGPEVAKQFDDRVVLNMTGKPRPHVDLKSAIKLQLNQCEIPDWAIEISPHCTFRQTDLFFSYRAEKGLTGRMMGFIGLVSRFLLQ